MSDIHSSIDVRTVRLPRATIEAVYKSMKETQHIRYRDWQQRNEHDRTDRSYPLPRMQDIYPRVDINSDEREALHVTRRAIESVTAKTFTGSQGEVAEWTRVVVLLGEHSEENSVVGQRSLTECLAILRENSYDISEGVRFIRTPLALRALERKYYLTDLIEY